MHSPAHISLGILVPRTNCPRARGSPLRMRAGYVFPQLCGEGDNERILDGYESSHCRVLPTFGGWKRQMKSPLHHCFITGELTLFPQSSKKRQFLRHIVTRKTVAVYRQPWYRRDNTVGDLVQCNNGVFRPTSTVGRAEMYLPLLSLM